MLSLLAARLPDPSGIDGCGLTLGAFLGIGVLGTPLFLLLCAIGRLFLPRLYPINCPATSSLPVFCCWRSMVVVLDIVRLLRLCPWRRRRTDHGHREFAAGVLERDRPSGRAGQLITFSVPIRESIFQNPFCRLPIVRAQDFVDHHRLACQERRLQRPVEFAVSGVGLLLTSLPPVVQGVSINAD